ncbi:hypothetical protein Bbelb_421350 [Branchiostoma belcheri]|nr:hypothetical protein Bbelb_421350 [Branchiostoma belcheri]
MDSTFGLNSYDLPLFTATVPNQNKEGILLFFLITSTDKNTTQEETGFKVGFTAVLQNLKVRPNAIVIDKNIRNKVPTHTLLLESDLYDFSTNAFSEMMGTYMTSMKGSRDEQLTIEQETRGQGSSEKWKEKRKEKLTASTLAVLLLVRATTYGESDETVAVDEYLALAHSEDFNVDRHRDRVNPLWRDCGWVLLLTGLCRKQGCTIKEAIQDRAFFLTKVDGWVCLKPSHKYYHQVAAELRQPVDPRVEKQIKKLALDGARKLNENKQPPPPITRRRFHPTDQDIRNILLKAKKQTRSSEDDQVNLQTTWQQKLLSMYGQQMCLLDATYRTCRYGLPLSFLLPRSVKNNGTEVDKEREKTRRLWVKFVAKHRRDFQPSATSVLCFAHFEPSCFSHNLEIGKSCERKRSRWLLPGALLQEYQRPMFRCKKNKSRETERKEGYSEKICKSYRGEMGKDRHMKYAKYQIRESFRTRQQGRMTQNYETWEEAYRGVRPNTNGPNNPLDKERASLSGPGVVFEHFERLEEVLTNAKIKDKRPHLIYNTDETGVELSAKGFSVS